MEKRRRRAKLQKISGNLEVFSTSSSTLLTNSTGLTDMALVDSGFSGYSVVGEKTLNKLRETTKISNVKSKSSNKFTFGAGKTVESLYKTEIIHPKVGSVSTDVVPGELPLLLGRIFLRQHKGCLLYTSPSPRDRTRSRMPSSA